MNTTSRSHSDRLICQRRQKSCGLALASGLRKLTGKVKPNSMPTPIAMLLYPAKSKNR
ncbi:Uncharacterised protein [Bordetella pertussis]|nr:Uncharacterised protein [Bordetella pertussis]CFO71055.1 Uncharacterised protein [Bordetella pertussis]CFP65211.1 Uncharacterised protein [Bordetella pertussis]CFU81850.1 Uncharacterised protein [Bordetella pertussis]CPI02249.1 Uncharacterised protein [Bordetella pertussis]